MKPKLSGDLIFTLALIALLAVMMYATLSFPLQLRYTPFITGGLTLGFLFVLVAGAINPRVLQWTETALQDLWGGGADNKIEETVETPSPWPSVLRVMAYAVGYLLAVYWLGFFLVTPIFLFLYLVLDAKAKVKTAFLTSAILSALLLTALVYLNVDLWIGRMPEILPDYIGGAIEPQF
jgi:hypothetical protein